MDSNKSDTDQINGEPQIPPDDLADSINRGGADVESGPYAEPSQGGGA